MARQELPKEEEIQEKSSNLRARLAKADWARQLKANQKPHESADQLPRTSRKPPTSSHEPPERRRTAPNIVKIFPRIP